VTPPSTTEGPAGPAPEAVPPNGKSPRFWNTRSGWLPHVLEDGPTRFNGIKRRLDVSSQVLTRVLRDLERDGLIERAVHTEVPVRVEYSLTSLGGTMCTPVHSVREWAEKVSSDIVDARAAWDRAHQANPGSTEAPGS
jgi:DNA-binding HxlR family transcriptional regulator